MDAGRQYTPTGSRAIPRQIVQGRNSPRNSAGTSVANEAREKHLTPIKTSSKRHSTQQQFTTKPAFNATDRLHRHVERDRQSGHPPHSRPSPFLQNSSYTRRSGKTPLWPLSRLESLPTEILEEIFLYTLALSIGGAFLNLPRASLPIGRKLSSDYVRKELVLRMCSDPQPMKWNKHYQTMRGFHNEHAITQSWILRQQWLDHDFLRHCIPDYMVSILLREMAEHKLHWLDHTGPLVNPRLEPSIRNYILNHFERSRPSPLSPDTHYIERQWVEPGPSMRHIILGLSPATGFISLQIHDTEKHPTVGPDGLESPPFYARWRILSLNSATQIPPHLLYGPWAVPKIEFLELLIRGGATVDWIHTTAGEIAERGFFDALRENNARALRALCICDNDTTPGERKDATYNTIPSRGVGVIPEQKHLLIAIDQGCQEDVVETLLNAPESECDLQATGVTQAIYQMEKRGWLERATWLAERRDIDRQRKMVKTGKPRRRKDGGWLKGPPDLRARAFSGF